MERCQRQQEVAYFDSLCHSQPYFDFERMDTHADRKELAMARRSGI